MKIKTYHSILSQTKTLSAIIIAATIIFSIGCSAGTSPGGGSEDGSFTTLDGTKLSGHVFGSGEVGVILSHTRYTTQEAWWPFARILEDKGYKVLAYDFRGFRDSEGSFDIDSMYRDTEAAITFMRDTGTSTIFLIGAGIGGTASIKAAINQDIAGIITISSSPQVETLDVRGDMREIHSPTLFIASREDGFYARSVDFLHQNAPDPKEKQIVDGDSHGIAMLSEDAGPRVQGAILDFIIRHTPGLLQ